MLSTRRNKAAFSLIELLTVIAIMAILASAVFFSTQSGTSSAALRGSISQMDSMVQLTREMALTHNCSARLMVAIDPTDLTRYCRFVVSVYQSTDSSGNPITSSGNNVWIQEKAGSFLPPAIYYDLTRSNSLSATGSVPSQVNFNFPGTLTDGSGPKWATYTFNANGTSAIPGSAMIFARALLSSTGTLSFPNAKLREGLVIQRLGSTVLFQDPSQIP